MNEALLAPFYGAVAGVRTRESCVALTFDDGPHPQWTPAVLEVLARHRARATFFCLGNAATEHRELVEATVLAGHAVGSHTLSHPSLLRLPVTEVVREIAAGHAALGDIASPLFRPPYGHYGTNVAKAAMRLGLTCVLWNGHAHDWLRLDASELARNLAFALRPGAVVLLHDSLRTDGPHGDPDRTALLVALDVVLAVNADVVRFVTVPELLTLGPPVKAMAEIRSQGRA